MTKIERELGEMTIGADRLLKDIEFVLTLPTLAFIMFAGNAKLWQKTGFTLRQQQVALVFCLLLFAFCLITIVQDRALLLALWRSSPFSYTVVYGISCLLILGAVSGLIYWKLRPSLWRRR